MIPYRDENPTRTFPIVVVGLIAANVAVFLYQAALPGAGGDVFVFTHGAIPAVLMGQVSLAEVLPRQLRLGAALAHTPIVPLQPIWLTLFTAMFVHGSVLHLGSNMLYLWIFGNNVEDALGHLRFAVFYLVCGLLAAGAQIAVSLHSAVPMIGASGAIAGVLGAYYVKFPRARVYCLVFLLFFITVVALPASLVLLFWFLLQIFQSLQAGAGGASGGVAVFAHIGGFVAGWLLVRRMAPRPRVPRPAW
jgi:membrane associated rhomboid family serine protease